MFKSNKTGFAAAGAAMLLTMGTAPAANAISVKPASNAQAPDTMDTLSANLMAAAKSAKAKAGELAANIKAAAPTAQDSAALMAAAKAKANELIANIQGTPAAKPPVVKAKAVTPPAKPPVVVPAPTQTVAPAAPAQIVATTAAPAHAAKPQVLASAAKSQIVAATATDADAAMPTKPIPYQSLPVKTSPSLIGLPKLETPEIAAISKPVVADLVRSVTLPAFTIVQENDDSITTPQLCMQKAVAASMGQYMHVKPDQVKIKPDMDGDTYKISDDYPNGTFHLSMKATGDHAPVFEGFVTDATHKIIGYAVYNHEVVDKKTGKSVVHPQGKASGPTRGVRNTAGFYGECMARMNTLLAQTNSLGN
jgi:hypothetical protein